MASVLKLMLDLNWLKDKQSSLITDVGEPWSFIQKKISGGSSIELV